MLAQYESKSNSGSGQYQPKMRFKTTGSPRRSGQCQPKTRAKATGSPWWERTESAQNTSRSNSITVMGVDRIRPKHKPKQPDHHGGSGLNQPTAQSQSNRTTMMGEDRISPRHETKQLDHHGGSGQNQPKTRAEATEPSWWERTESAQNTS